MEIVPPLLAVLASLMFALNVYVQQRGLDGTSALSGAFISVASMTLVFWVLAPFYLDNSWWWTKAALLFFLCGLFLPALGQRMSIASLTYVGPSLTSSLGSFVPVFAIAPTVLLLDENFGWQAALGIATMTVGLILAADPRSGQKRAFPLWTLCLPLGAAAVRGFAQPLAKFGMLEVPEPLFVVLVMGTVSFFVLGIFVLAAGERPSQALKKPGAGWFALSGVINGFAILSLTWGILWGEITVVAPLASTTPLWVLLMGAFIFKRETLTKRHALVAVLVVAGATLLLTR